MATQVTCKCGRKFWVHDGKACQCRKCGRWWSGKTLGLMGVIVHNLCGGETAPIKRAKGQRHCSIKRKSTGKQTNKTHSGSNIGFAILQGTLKFYWWMIQETLYVCGFFNKRGK